MPGPSFAGPDADRLNALDPATEYERLHGLCVALWDSGPTEEEVEYLLDQYHGAMDVYWHRMTTEQQDRYYRS